MAKASTPPIPPTRSRQALVTALLFAHVGVAALVVVGLTHCTGCGMKDPTMARLDLADATITIDQPDGVHHALTLAASGAVAWDGKPLLTISKSGALTAGGRAIAVVDKHGAITVHGQPTNLAVRPDGSFELDGVAELTIDRDGTIAGPLIKTIDHPALVLDGSKLAYVGPPAARWATLLGFAAVLSPSLGVTLPR